MTINLIDIQNEYEKNNNFLNKDDVTIIQNWLNKQPHLPLLTEFDIILMLHASFYNIEKTKELIDKHYTVRTKCPEFFNSRYSIDKNLHQALNTILFGILPELTPNDDRVMICKIIVNDPNCFSFVDGLKLFTMVCDLWLYEYGTSNGHIIVCDISDTTLGHLPKINLIALNKIMYYFQETIPLRLKGLHFVNIVPFMDKIMTLLKPFLKKDLITIHSKLEDLYNHVPKNMLPVELGGNGESYKILQEKTMARINSNLKWFENEEQYYRVDETKRLKSDSQDCMNDLFGTVGSFRKLNID